MDFDVLNRLEKPRYIEYSKYFGDMALSKSQIDNRLEYANTFERNLLPVISIIYLMIENDTVDINKAKNDAYNCVVDTLLECGFVLSVFYHQYARNFADEFVETTLDNIDDKYFFSVDRVKVNAENEANTVYNHKEYVDAVESGYIRKQWIDMKDARERETHREVGSQVIGIDDFFEVGGYLMRYPKDVEYGAGAEEVINCRCTIKYIK